MKCSLFGMRLTGTGNDFHAHVREIDFEVTNEFKSRRRKFLCCACRYLCRPKLGSQLRRMCDKIGTRLWIASPYVGSWEVRKVLGRRWFDGDSIDVRLLTDPDERIINRNTALRFAEKGTIKKLRGLHAKLFIVDDQVLLTSANLTYSAFAMRHEVGIVLDGDAARSAVSQFESWWKMAKGFTMESVLSLPRKSLATAGEDEKSGLPDPTDLPADPGDFGGGFISIFRDYRDFLKYYKRLAKEYERLEADLAKGAHLPGSGCVPGLPLSSR